MLKMVENGKVVSIKRIKAEGDTLVLYTGFKDNRSGRIEIKVRGFISQPNLELAVDKVYNNLIRMREWANLRTESDQYCSNIIQDPLRKQYPSVSGLLGQLTMQLSVGILDSEIEKVVDKFPLYEEENLFNIGGSYIVLEDNSLEYALWGIHERNKVEKHGWEDRYITNAVEFNMNPFRKTYTGYKIRMELKPHQQTREVAQGVISNVYQELQHVYKVGDKREIGVVHLGVIKGIMEMVAKKGGCTITTNKEKISR